MQLWPSSARVQFTQIRNQSKLVSEKYQVPDVDATWWIEVAPVLIGQTDQTFAASLHIPPNVKIFIEVDDEEMTQSHQLRAKIDIKEVSDATNTWVHFDGSTRSITKHQSDFLAPTAYSLQNQQNHRDRVRYGYDSEDDEEHEIDDAAWTPRDDFSFDVSLTLTYSGKFNRIEHQVKRIMKAGKTWNPVESLLESGNFADFTFVVRGRKFEVHKCILSAASEVMNKMFTCGLNETKNNVATIDYDSEIFRHFLRFVYTKIAPQAEMPKICVQLYDIAHSYGVELLEKICKVYIVETAIDADNALEMYEFAATHGVSEVLDKSWEFIKTQILGIKEPTEPKSVDQVRALLEKKRKFDEEMRTLVIAEEVAAAESSEPPKKKRRTRKNK